MKRIGRFEVACFWIVGTVLCGSLAAQTGTQSRETIELSRTVIQAKRQTIVAQAIDLTDVESKAFWPLYREWRTASANLEDRIADMVSKLNDEYDTLTDEEAGRLMDEWFDVKAREQKLNARYAKQFRKILPPKKALRFLQLENKMDSIVTYSLSGTVPLAE